MDFGVIPGDPVGVVISKQGDGSVRIGWLSRCVTRRRPHDMRITR